MAHIGRLDKAPKIRGQNHDMLLGLRKSGFFSRGRFGGALGSTAFFEAALAAAGLAADLAFVPVVFTAFGLAADLTGLGFLGITVNSISFPQ
jgi:hypothetical protein